jgi:hypothetical protein
LKIITKILIFFFPNFWNHKIERKIKTMFPTWC